MGAADAAHQAVRTPLVLGPLFRDGLQPLPFWGEGLSLRATKSSSRVRHVTLVKKLWITASFKEILCALGDGMHYHLWVVPKLSQLLSQMRHKLREADFTTMCDRCGEERSIADCKTKANTEIRTYRCSLCGDLLVLVGVPSDRVMSGEELRAGDWWSIRPSTVLFVTLGRSKLRIPAVPRAALYGEPLI